MVVHDSCVVINKGRDFVFFHCGFLCMMRCCIKGLVKSSIQFRLCNLFAFNLGNNLTEYSINAFAEVSHSSLVLTIVIDHFNECCLRYDDVVHTSLAIKPVFILEFGD